MLHFQGPPIQRSHKFPFFSFQFFLGFDQQILDKHIIEIVVVLQKLSDLAFLAYHKMTRKSLEMLSCINIL